MTKWKTPCTWMGSRHPCKSSGGSASNHKTRPINSQQHLVALAATAKFKTNPADSQNTDTLRIVREKQKWEKVTVGQGI